jgi:hypothetical protein
VIAALITGYFTDWFGIGGPANRAIVRVVAFEQYGHVSNQAPSAAITIEDEGKKTAENCVIHWKPGMNGSVGFPHEETSTSFALDLNGRQSVNLQSRYTYGGTGTFYGQAWVACSNATSPVDTATVFVFT